MMFKKKTTTILVAASGQGRGLKKNGMEDLFLLVFLINIYYIV